MSRVLHTPPELLIGSGQSVVGALDEDVCFRDLGLLGWAEPSMCSTDRRGLGPGLTSLSGRRGVAQDTGCTGGCCVALALQLLGSALAFVVALADLRPAPADGVHPVLLRPHIAS